MSINLRWAGRLLSALSLFFIAPAPHAASADSSHVTVSLVRLIANPANYAGKPIQTIGFLCIAEEEENLYLSEEDYLHGLYINSIDLRLTESQRERAKTLNLKYVIVEGTLSLHGVHPNWPMLRLVNIHRLDEWNIHRQPPADAPTPR
jgi:hypothetical protein